MQDKKEMIKTGLIVIGIAALASLITLYGKDAIEKMKERKSESETQSSNQ